MSGTKKEHVKIILQTIENGTLSETEAEQRLLGLVRQEAERKDRPADLGLIRACVELGDHLQGRSGDVDSERIDKLKRRIAIAYEKRMRKKEKSYTQICFFRSRLCSTGCIFLFRSIGRGLKAGLRRMNSSEF